MRSKTTRTTGLGTTGRLRAGIAAVTLASAGVIGLAACGAGAPTVSVPRSVVGTSSSAEHGGSTPSGPSAGSPSGSTSASTRPLATLSGASFEAALITTAQVAQFGSHLVRYDPNSDSGVDGGGSSGGSGISGDDVVGTGGTCPALATSVNSDTVFSSDPDDGAAAGYDNSDTAQSAPELRDVEEAIESYPALDTTRELTALRSAIAGCHRALRTKGGDTVRVSLADAPTAYGDAALAFRLGYSGHGLTLDVDCLAVVEGHNLLTLTVSGLTAAQQTVLLATVWADLGHTPDGSI